MITCGIDNGTQSTKVIVYDSESRKVLSLTQSKHPLRTGENGEREQLASWWIDALRECFSLIPDEVRKRIEAVGVSAQMHGFVPVASDGEVLYPVKLWCDTSTVEECEALNSALGGRVAAIEKTGNEIKTGYTAPKVLWLKRKRSDLYKKMRWIMLPHDYLNFVLTGEAGCEYGDASGTAFLDVRTRKWSEEVLHAVDSDRDLRECLPPLHSPGLIGRVSKRASDLFSIPSGIRVSTGGGDNMMSAIGTGTVREGDLALSMGTSGTLYGTSSVPVVDRKGRVAAFCSSTGGWLPLLCTMNCTVSSEVTRTLFNRDIESFNEAASSSPIGCNGVYMLPYFNGERTPNYPSASGCIFGLTPANMKEENISRAAMEASVYAMKYGLDAFLELGFNPGRIILTGGGSKSALWRRMVSDVTNVVVTVPENEESAAFGAALDALYAVEKENGRVESISEITSRHVKMDDEKTCLPSPAAHEEYMKTYGEWLKAVENVAPLFS